MRRLRACSQIDPQDPVPDAKRRVQVLRSVPQTRVLLLTSGPRTPTVVSLSRELSEG